MGSSHMCHWRTLWPLLWASKVAQSLLASARAAGDPGSIPGQEDPLEEEMATLSSIPGLENPIYRGAWGATVHRVAKSQIQLGTYA